MGGAAIRCEGIAKSFGGRQVLNGVNLEVGKGRIIGLLGPNGAGKTTLIRIMSAQLRPSRGTVLIGGKPLQRRDRVLLRTLGVVPQEPALYGELTLRENLMFMAKVQGIRGENVAALCSDLLEELGLGSHADRRASECSTGMRQVLNILMGLLHAPLVLLLDEPTVGLDLRVRRLVWSRLERMAAEGGAVLVATHALQEAQDHCHEVAFLHRGKVIAKGPPRVVAEELAGAEDLEEAFLEISGEVG